MPKTNTTVDEVMEAAAPKKRGRKPGSKNRVAAKAKPGKPGRKAAPKKAHTPAPEVYVQVAGQEFNCTAIMERARADYRSTHKTGIHTCKVYIKPEENAAYYVINQVEGKLPLE